MSNIYISSQLYYTLDLLYTYPIQYTIQEYYILQHERWYSLLNMSHYTVYGIYVLVPGSLAGRSNNFLQPSAVLRKKSFWIASRVPRVILFPVAHREGKRLAVSGQVHSAHKHTQ